MSEKPKEQLDIISPFDLIPTGDYHSCVITGYSFDFLFFEKFVMPKLRALKISNVNLLVDPNMYEQSISDFNGTKLPSDAGYSIEPARVPRLFHSKVMLFFGDNEGLAFIGSGNPTQCGYGLNQEIWSAIHIKDATDPKASAFLQLWNNFRIWSQGVPKYFTQKLDWITLYSPWLKQAKPVDPPWLLSEGRSIEIWDTTSENLF
ncbi:MAG: hypothetical protein AB7H97_07685, partial [Pseudobdellovibrionaceae bacterium]